MNSIIYELAEFITTPLFRWLFLFLGIILTLLQYLNSPQRFSYKKAKFGLSFKWYMYFLCMFNLFNVLLSNIELIDPMYILSMIRSPSKLLVKYDLKYVLILLIIFDDVCDI